MINSYLQRKSYLQRYIKGVTQKQLASFSKGDKQIINAVREFMDNASQADINALLRNNTNNKAFSALDAVIVTVIAKQTASTIKYLNSELSDYIQSEINFTYKMFDSDKPKPKVKPILNTVISGATVAQTVNTMQSRTMDRLRRDIATSVKSGTDPILKLKGTKALNYKDGLFFYRDSRQYKPTLDGLITGAGGNAMLDSMKRVAPKQKLRWLDTLDGRVCIRCAVAGSNSPYEQGKAPPYPMHPFDRCILLPDIQAEGERPFVASFTSVSKIPKGKRKGLIGTVSGKTKFSQWFKVQDTKFQKKWLGKSRYKLYKSGEFKLSEFVDPRTNKIYTLEQLDAL